MLRLTERGCPCCRAGNAGEQREVGAFVTEHYSSPVVMAGIRRSHGFCPPHTRLLLTRPEAGFVLPTVYREAVEAALAASRRTSIGRPGSPCLLCEAHDGAAERAAWFILRGLSDERVSRAFVEAGGFCLPHALSALPVAGSVEAEIVVSTLVAQLHPLEVPPELAWVAGGDRDCFRRARLRRAMAALAAELPLAAPLEERLSALLRVESCVGCLEGGLMEVRYLGWLGEEIGRRPDLVLVDGTRLCPRHLHDLHCGDADAGAWMTRRSADVAHWQLHRASPHIQAMARPWRDLRARLRPVFRQRQGAAVAEILRGPRARWRESLRAVARGFDCTACAAVAEAEAAAIDLLRVGLRDARLRAAFLDSHGLCLHHRHRLPTVSASLPHERLQVRLGIMAWELHDAARKTGWSARYHFRGNESEGWIRAPALLDGRVYLGGPARQQYRALHASPLLDADRGGR
jgi:hypothetical protein